MYRIVFSLVCVALDCALVQPVSAAMPRMHVRAGEGRLTILEDKTPVLVFNREEVAPTPDLLAKIAPGNRKYAQPRSGYIHPLYGPLGEELTRDWPVDHPHHRGIYWAWPEVTWNGEMRDLHSLQGIFSRPTGEVTITDGDKAATLTATSEWKWDDKIPVVRETVTLCAERSGSHGRHIDLTVTLEALEEGVTIARRRADQYGGLCTRLAPAKNLTIEHHADTSGTPIMAWHRASGIWGKSTEPVSITIFEKTANPGYPADHVQYPAYPWFQPAFPKAGVRYALEKGNPLTLQYRYWIQSGTPPDEASARTEWRQFNELQTENNP